MNIFKEFKINLKLIIKNPIILYIQLIPISLLLIQAYFAPIVLNPVFGFYHGVSKEGLIIIYITNISLFFVNYLILISHNLFIKNYSKQRKFKFNLRKSLRYYARVLIGGLIINSLYYLGSYFLLIPSILVLALFLFYNQGIILSNKGIIYSLKKSVSIFKNNLGLILNFLTLIFGLSIIKWIPFGTIFNYLLQPAINLTIARAYLKKFK